MSSLPAPLRPSSASIPSGAAPPKPVATTLGQLPRKPGSASKRAAPLVGLLANPGSPSALGFSKQGAGFGRVGAQLEPASPVEKAKRIANHSPLLGSPTRARRLGSFNSLATPQVAPPLSTRTDDQHSATHPVRGAHRLRHQWVFWVLSRAPSRKMSEEEFGRSIRRIGSCDTVETFYSVYLHIKRPSAQPPITDLHIFLDPIRPVWEDPANAAGGKWTVRLRKGLADRLWETVVLSLVGGSLEKLVVGNQANNQSQMATREICGAVLSVRRDEDILAVWHRSGSPESGADGKMAKQVKLSLQTVLKLPLTCTLAYKLNADSLASGTTNGLKFSPPDGGTPTGTRSHRGGAHSAGVVNLGVGGGGGGGGGPVNIGNNGMNVNYQNVNSSTTGFNSVNNCNGPTIGSVNKPKQGIFTDQS